MHTILCVGRVVLAAVDTVYIQRMIRHGRAGHRLRRRGLRGRFAFHLIYDFSVERCTKEAHCCEKCCIHQHEHKYFESQLPPVGSDRLTEYSYIHKSISLVMVFRMIFS